MTTAKDKSVLKKYIYIYLSMIMTSIGDYMRQKKERMKTEIGKEGMKRAL